MRKQLFKSFYSKLTFGCAVIFFFATFFITVFALVFLNNNRINTSIEEYNAILAEMVQLYDDIYNENYKVFLPIYSETNKDSFSQFCRGDTSGYEKGVVTKNFERILSEICLQDRRIKGVHFRNFTNDTCYVYFMGEEKMREVTYRIENEDGKDVKKRAIIGGRKINYGFNSSNTQSMNVFGIQSRVLSATGKGDAEYQLTVLYDLSHFDEIFLKYKYDSTARFMIISQQGLVIYDSLGKYEDEQSFIDMDASVFVNEQNIYLRKTQDTTKGDCLAFYMVSENAIKNFKFEGTAKIVVIVAIIINIMMIFAMNFVNYIINRKFNELEKGIYQVGVNNLNYRIPVSGKEDEFYRIASRFNKMCDDLQMMIDKNYVYIVMQQKAAYEQLKTTVNPHFLYNSLGMIRNMLSEKGQDDMADIVLGLSRIFDYQIHGDSIATIWIEKEALQNYMEFISARYQYNFEYYIDFDEKILDYNIPKLTFQPFVETYFEHGFMGDGSDCIWIRGYLDESDNMIHIIFKDNAQSNCEERIKKINALLTDEKESMENIQKRIRILCGKNSRIELSTNEPKPGISVTLVLEKILMTGITDSKRIAEIFED